MLSHQRHGCLAATCSWTYHTSYEGDKWCHLICWPVCFPSCNYVTAKASMMAHQPRIARQLAPAVQMHLMLTSALSLEGRIANQHSSSPQGIRFQRAAGLPSSRTVSLTASSSPQLLSTVLLSALISFTELPKPVLCTCRQRTACSQHEQSAIAGLVADCSTQLAKKGMLYDVYELKLQLAVCEASAASGCFHLREPFNNQVELKALRSYACPFCNLGFLTS